jgi:hypothetical protein
MTRLGLRRITFALLMILGVAVGRQHALDSARALFTLPGSAPISAHLAVLSGPLLTLPAVLLALLSRRVCEYAAARREPHLRDVGHYCGATGFQSPGDPVAVRRRGVLADGAARGGLSLAEPARADITAPTARRRETLRHSKSGEFRLLLGLLLVVGAYAGCARFLGGWQAFTLLGRDAGMAARLAIACGQLLLLPALACVLVSIRIAGCVLVGMAIVATASWGASSLGQGIWLSGTIAYIWNTSALMLLLGVGLLCLGRQNRTPFDPESGHP